MARRARRSSSRSYGGYGRNTRSTRRSTSRPRSSGRRATSRSTRGTMARGQTVRIVLEQPQSSMVARPELIGKMPIVGLTRNRSRF